MKNIRLRGLQMHIGSQLTTVKPFELAVRKVLPLVSRLKSKYGLEFFSIGGGLGIMYQNALSSGSPQWWQSSRAKQILTPAKYAAKLVPLLMPLQMRILIEPGRFIVGNAGILVTRVEYIKRTGKKNFVIVDAAMNDFIRPAFYDSYHEIVPLTQKNGSAQGHGLVPSDVVGPICESGDYLAKGRALPQTQRGDLLAVFTAGAYGFAMSSNYNNRPRAAEVLVDGDQFKIIRRRETYEDLIALEIV